MVGPAGPLRQQRQPRTLSVPRARAPGIVARNRARVKRGSRLVGSSAKRMRALRSVAISRAFGTSSSGRTSASPAIAVGIGEVRAIAPRPPMPLPRVEPDQNGLGLIVERVGGQHGTRAGLSPRRRAADSAPAARPPAIRWRACAPCQRKVRCATPSLRASRFTAAASRRASSASHDRP